MSTVFTPEFIEKLKSMGKATIVSGDKVEIKKSATELVKELIRRSETGLKAFGVEVAEEGVADFSLIGLSINEAKKIIGLDENSDHKNTKTRRVMRTALGIAAKADNLVFRCGRYKATFGAIDLSDLSATDQYGLFMLFTKADSIDYCYAPMNKVKGHWASSFLTVDPKDVK